MKVFLDSKDLIDILQDDNPCSVDQLEDTLVRGRHQLAVSCYTVTEISVPLAHSSLKTNVMALLNRLERMPIAFIHAGVDALELKEALDAFSSQREYREIHPFVGRFDDALVLDARPRNRIFINCSLAETVWDLYSHGSLQGLESYAKRMREIVTRDRSLKKPPTLKTHFTKVIQRNLKLHNLSRSHVSLPDFANWIYENPNRCPAIRLGYEVWHKIVRNKTDALEDSDMEDYQHLTCLPYAHLMTLDRRMHGYVSQASASMSLDYCSRIFRSVQDLLCHL